MIRSYKENVFNWLDAILVELSDYNTGDEEFIDTMYNLEENWDELSVLVMELKDKFQETIDMENKWRKM